MRFFVPAFFGLWVVVLAAGCGDPPIGQPCTFSWPKNEDGSFACSEYPACHPLQEAGGAVTLNNQGCPIDCIQLSSLECENLICVATQVEGEDKAKVMNGRCGEDVESADCAEAPFGCMGYCSKECLTDAGCPKGYSCSNMAPFGETLRCDNDEEDWASSDPDKKCTATCYPAGESPPGSGITCPESGLEADYSKCNTSSYSRCCACICYQFCPILAKKFCRKQKWDQNMFEDAITENTNCGD